MALADWDFGVQDLAHALEGAIRTAIAEEREACAKVADEKAASAIGKGKGAAEWIAAAIRARGDKPAKGEGG